MMSLGLVSCASRSICVVVDLFLGGEAVAHDLEPLAAHVERHAVGEVAAFGQAHAHDRVAGLEQGEEHRLVGLRAGVRLDVGEAGVEQLLHPVDRQLLGHVDELAAAVVALARVALGVLVGELAALGGHHRGGGVVLRGDQLDVLFLALVLALDDRGDLRVGVGEDGRTAVKHRSAPAAGVRPRNGASGWPRRTARPAVASRNGRLRSPVVPHLRPEERAESPVAQR